jgi:hypothetical protein
VAQAMLITSLSERAALIQILSASLLPLFSPAAFYLPTEPPQAKGRASCLALPCLALPCLALPCLALPCLAYHNDIKGGNIAPLMAPYFSRLMKFHLLRASKALPSIKQSSSATLVYFEVQMGLCIYSSRIGSLFGARMQNVLLVFSFSARVGVNNWHRFRALSLTPFIYSAHPDPIQTPAPSLKCSLRPFVRSSLATTD